MLVCRSPSGCWHEHRHCQYRYGVGSQYGEYSGFGDARSRRGGAVDSPAPAKAERCPRACGDPTRPPAPGRRRGGAGWLLRGRGGSGAALPRCRRRMPGGERRGRPGCAGPLLRQLRGRSRPQRLPASNGALCRPRARTAPARPPRLSPSGAFAGAVLRCLVKNKLTNKQNNNNWRCLLAAHFPLNTKRRGFYFCVCSKLAFSPPSLTLFWMVMKESMVLEVYSFRDVCLSYLNTWN